MSARVLGNICILLFWLILKRIVQGGRCVSDTRSHLFDIMFFIVGRGGYLCTLTVASDMASVDERWHSTHYDAMVYTLHGTFIARGVLQPISRTNTNNIHFYRLDNETAKEYKYMDLVARCFNVSTPYNMISIILIKRKYRTWIVALLVDSSKFGQFKWNRVNLLYLILNKNTILSRW